MNIYNIYMNIYNIYINIYNINGKIYSDIYNIYSNIYSNIYQEDLVSDQPEQLGVRIQHFQRHLVPRHRHGLAVQRRCGVENRTYLLCNIYIVCPLYSHLVLVYSPMYLLVR